MEAKIQNGATYTVVSRSNPAVGQRTYYWLGDHGKELELTDDEVADLSVTDFRMPGWCLPLCRCHRRNESPATPDLQGSRGPRQSSNGLLDDWSGQGPGSEPADAEKTVAEQEPARHRRLK